jgi:hypothetical protein
MLQDPVKREAPRSKDNPALINLQPRHRLLQANHEAEGKEDKAPMVNLVGSQKAQLKLRRIRDRENRSAGRKKARGRRRQGPSAPLICLVAVSGAAAVPAEIR